MRPPSKPHGLEASFQPTRASQTTAPDDRFSGTLTRAVRGEICRILRYLTRLLCDSRVKSRDTSVRHARHMRASHHLPDQTISLKTDLNQPTSTGPPNAAIRARAGQRSVQFSSAWDLVESLGVGSGSDSPPKHRREDATLFIKEKKSSASSGI